MLRIIGKYAGYYIVASILVSLFVTAALQPVIHAIVGGIIALAMFVAILHMILGDIGGGILLRISDWCVRCTFIAVVILSILGIGWDKIFRADQFMEGVIRNDE